MIINVLTTFLKAALLTSGIIGKRRFNGFKVVSNFNRFYCSHGKTSYYCEYEFISPKDKFILLVGNSQCFIDTVAFASYISNNTIVLTNKVDINITANIDINGMYNTLCLMNKFMTNVKKIGLNIWYCNVNDVFFEEKEECPITMIEPPYHAFRLKCGHSISLVALSNTIKQNNVNVKCPFCREKLEVNELNSGHDKTKNYNLNNNLEEIKSLHELYNGDISKYSIIKTNKTVSFVKKPTHNNCQKVSDEINFNIDIHSQPISRSTTPDIIQITQQQQNSIIEPNLDPGRYSYLSTRTPSPQVPHRLEPFPIANIPYPFQNKNRKLTMCQLRTETGNLLYVLFLLIHCLLDQNRILILIHRKRICFPNFS